MALKLSTINKIKSLTNMGLRPPEIASKLNISVKAVRTTLKGKNGSEQLRIADRAEALLGGITNDSGCYVTKCHDYDDISDFGYSVHQQEVCEHVDPVFEEVAFYEELEQFIDKLEEK